MNQKEISIKGATILIVQHGEWVKFYMNYKTEDFIYCGSKIAKVEDLEGEDFLDIWKSHIDDVIGKENVLISFSRRCYEELLKKRKQKRISLPTETV